MSLRSWPEMADWYHERQGDTGDLWHRTLLDPAIFARVGEIADCDVIDLACGNGHNTRRLAHMGARVVGVDASAGVIAHCRAREAQEPLGITYHVADAARLDMLADASFDLVVCQMALMDIPDAEGAIREAVRVLRPTGRFLAMILHPCFEIPGASGWVDEQMGPTTTVWRKISHYSEPFVGREYWRVADEIIYMPSYHRPLSWYMRAFDAAGLALTGFDEPRPTEEFRAARPDSARFADVPLMCLFEAVKQHRD